MNKKIDMRGRHNSNIYFFYVVYKLDIFELPVAYCETLEELGKIFNKTRVTMAVWITHHKTNTNNPNAPFRDNKGNLYAVSKWRQNPKTQAVEMLFKIGGTYEDLENSKTQPN